MPPVTQADPRSRRLGSRSPLQVTRDLAALVGAAVTIGFAAGMGLMLTVLVLG